MKNHPATFIGAIDWNDVRAAQFAINSWANTALPDRVPEASLSKLVMEEVPELLIHRKERGTVGIGQELVDCLILLLDLAVIWDVDVPNALRAKMEINANRTWVLDEATGFYNHKESDNAVQD